MTNQQIFEIAMEQSAWDINCAPEDFLKEEPVLVDGIIGPKARKYYKEPVACNLVSYGNNVVASMKPEYREIVAQYLGKFEWYHCFETPNLHWLDDRLKPLGQSSCFMAEYYLPDVEKLKLRHCGFDLGLLTQADFRPLYLPQWSNALCEARKELDVLGVGAWDGDRLVALAGASADGEKMWQIGIDVLPDYRRKGIAAALVSRLALEILDRGKVPFYCSAWSNLRSMRTAMASGFRPAWVEMTVKPTATVSQMNQ